MSREGMIGGGPASSINQAVPGDWRRPNVGEAMNEGEQGTLIRNEICEAEEIAAALYQAIDLLEKRIDTALTPAPPVGLGGVGASATVPGEIVKRPPCADLTSRVRHINHDLRSAVERLAALRRRVEI